MLQFTARLAKQLINWSNFLCCIH